MVDRVLKSGMLDRWAIGLSGLCLLHCLATTIFVVVLTTAAGELLNPLVHEVGLGLAIILGALSLGFGVVRHGNALPVTVGVSGLGLMAFALTLPHDVSELGVTAVGVSLLALAHLLNRRAAA